MDFCPLCGTRLTPIKKEQGSKAKLFRCPRCGFEEKATDTKEIVPKVIEHSSQERIVIIGKEDQKLRTLPTITFECPKCGNNLAYVWQVQTRGGDEASTQFFRCTKCNHTSREYS